MEIGFREPTAKELVQRRKILIASESLTSKRAPLSPQRGPLSAAVGKTEGSPLAIFTYPNWGGLPNHEQHETVSMLHQSGCHTVLLYGKNGVRVQAMQKGVAKNMKGYLSLHKEHKSLHLRWTPNLLMSIGSGEANATKVTSPAVDSSYVWNYALNIRMDDVAYIHLHQNAIAKETQSEVWIDANERTSMVLVNRDGLQHYPLQFETGRHCYTFLSCLENGLQPGFGLEPPLEVLTANVRTETGKCIMGYRYTDNGGASATSSRYMTQLSTPCPATDGGSDKLPSGSFSAEVTGCSINNYVFRIAPTGNASYHRPIQPATSNCGGLEKPDQDTIAVGLRLACASVRTQIKARVFYGWLTYCCQLKTIRLRLAALVNPTYHIGQDEADSPVSEGFWSLCRAEKSVALYKQLLHRVYLRGVEARLRSEVWPYLLRVVEWHEELRDHTQQWRRSYSSDLLQWQEVEAEVLKRDAEAFQAARERQQAALSGGSEIEHPALRISDERSLSNDVFLEEGENHVSQEAKKPDPVEQFASNLHRIEKDVQRCDRATEFFSQAGHGDENLPKLKRLMCTYVWRNLDEGYVQGMCDIASPLLVIFKDEVLTCECFSILMRRMRSNFPQNKDGIEENLTLLRYLVQVMDPPLYGQMMNTPDNTSLYFAYRWLLLDFKRELTYDEVFKVWETIWAAEKTVSPKFQLFLCLALLTQYRELLIENNFDYTDVLKFFNEMAEKHSVEELLTLARNKLSNLQQVVKELRS